MVAGRSPDGLPAGWTEQVNVKNGRKIKCYIDPLTGRKFYSKPQVSEYLKTVEHNSSASQQKDTDTVSPNTAELTGSKTTLKAKESQRRTRSSSQQIEMGLGNQPIEKPNMGGFSGGKPSLNEEESQNVKTLKRTSSKSKRKQTGSSMQPVEKPNLGELTGGKTSLKEEKSQNLNTESEQKQAGTSVQPSKKIVLERVTPDGLPPGWLKEIRVQKKANGTRKDPYYTDPKSGYVFFSQKDALRYLETGDFNSCCIKPKKRAELEFLHETLVVQPNMGALTGAQLEEGSQNVETPNRTNRTTKRKQMSSTKQPGEKVMIERVAPDGLPPGWLKETYYTDPVSGYVFFSHKDALCYLETGDVGMCTIKPKKRDELGFINEDTSPNKAQLTAVKNTVEQEGSQNVTTLKRTRYVSKQKQMGLGKQSVETGNMGELTGGKTSLKQEEPKTVKTPKRTSSVSKQKQMGLSKQSVEKEMIERVTPDGLPSGWIKEVQIQKKANGTRKYTYYTDPASGYVFWSQKDALRYLEAGDVSRCTVKPKKRDDLGFLNEESSPNMVELTGSKTPLELEGSQNVETQKRTSSASKRKQMAFSEQSGEKVEIERVTSQGLPPGWIKEIRIQMKENGIRRDPYYTDPVSGYVFGSQKDALRYLETGDLSSCATKPRKREELGFLNGESSLPSSAITQKSGRHTPKRQLFAGTQNSVGSNLETTDAGGPRKRQRIPKQKQSLDNEIEECADTEESGDPSWSPLPQTKSPKRKRGKRVDAENGTISTPTSDTVGEKNLEENGRKSKTAIGSSKSENKKASALPCRSSRRLVEHNSEMVRSGQSEGEPLLGAPDNVAHMDPHQFQTVLETEIADCAFRGTESPSTVELSNTSKNPLEGQAVPEDHPVIEETEKKDEESQDEENPFGDSWSDPCLEFAFKTLSGEMHVEDNLPSRDNIHQEAENSNPQSGGCLSLLDFGVPNFFQNDNDVSNFDVPAKTVCDSVPKPTGPTFIASGNVSSPSTGAPLKSASDSVSELPTGRTFLSSGIFSLPSSDAPVKPASDTAPLFPTIPTFPASGSISSKSSYAPEKPVTDSVPLFPTFPTFLASGNISSPSSGATGKPASYSVPQLTTTPVFLASGNISSRSYDTPWKPVSDSVTQLPTNPAFLASGNASSPTWDGNAPQQPMVEGNKQHQPNLNL